MGLPMWIPHGTLLQIPPQSHIMGCPYKTNIKSHMGPLCVPYLLLTEKRKPSKEYEYYIKKKENKENKTHHFALDKAWVTSGTGFIYVAF